MNPPLDGGKQDGMNRSRKIEDIRHDISRKIEIIDKLPAIVSTLSEDVPKEAVPRILIRVAKELFHASKAGYFAREEDASEFVLINGFGYPPDMVIAVRQHAQEQILGMAIQKRQIISRDDLLVGPGDNPEGFSVGSHGIDIVAPVHMNSQNMGVLVLGGCAVDIASERGYVAMLADLAGLALQNAIKKDTLKSVSLDDLTGLNNRRFFSRWFETEMRRAKNYMLPLSLFLFKIDQFKAVNDSHGRDAGDLVLKTLGTIIRRHTRSSDLVARYSGEEFAAIITCSAKEQALVYANHLSKTIAATRISLPGVEEPVGVTISGGVASFPIDGDSTSELIHAAENALGGARRKTKNEVIPS